MQKITVWVDTPRLAHGPAPWTCTAAAATEAMDTLGFSVATAVSKADVEKTFSLVQSLQKAIDRLIDMLAVESDEQRRVAIKRKRQDLDVKLQQQEKALKDMRGYVSRLMGKLRDLQHLIQQTVEKQGAKAALRLKEKYNDMYRSYYGKDYYHVG